MIVGMIRYVRMIRPFIRTELAEINECMDKRVPSILKQTRVTDSIDAKEELSREMTKLMIERIDDFKKIHQ